MEPRRRWQRFTVRLCGALAALLTLGAAPTASHAQPRVLYLTFDDGPSQVYTPQILNVLRAEHVRATFFVLGYRSEQMPQLVRRMRAEGHAIGSHGYYHEHIVHKSDEWVQHDLHRADIAIRRASGSVPVLYRPPGGMIDAHEKSMIQRSGHPVVLWTVDSMDWKTTSPQKIVDNVMMGVHPGAIILCHDGVSNSRYTVQALPALIRACRARGYVFQTLGTPHR
ncbi:MAG: polysaccharide deacetylase family protein [Alicyclobacillus sp.]|nr:polysaccharide deacetylase family protein [Alicyclobacillus sp.]